MHPCPPVPARCFNPALGRWRLRSPSGILAFELCRELIGAPRQQSDVGADRGEQAAKVDVVLGEFSVAGQNSRRAAGVLDAWNHVVDDLDDFGMGGLTEIAKPGR